MEKEINMKLNIYDKKKVVKTYEAYTYDLMFGTLEDIAGMIKLDEMKTGTDAEILRMITSAVAGSMDTIKELMMDIFDGITAEELKHTKVKEIVEVLFDVIRYTIAQLKLGGNEKN